MITNSHMDLGWLETMEHYYSAKDKQLYSGYVKGIFEHVLIKLKEDKNNKYTIAEVGYLERWWRDLKDEDKNTFKEMAKNG